MPLQIRPVTQRRPRRARYNGPDHTWASELNEVALRDDFVAGYQRMERRVSLPVLSLSDQRLSAKASSEGWRLCLRPNTSFASVGTFSNEENFTRGNPKGLIEWISHEAEAFEEILNSRGDICAFSGARGIATVLERKGCEHVKSLAQSEATLSLEDIKDPSAEASMVGGKFFTDIWDNGGREMAQEIIQKSEKGIHDARKIAEAAEKSTEPEGQIGTN